MKFEFPLSASQARTLFFATVFPVHFWAILLFILNAPNAKGADARAEALAIAGYILLFALFESAVIFLGLLGLGFLLPRRWGAEHRFGVLLALLALLVLWSLVAQLAALVTIPKTPFFIYIGINLANTLLYRQIAYALIVVLVLLSVLASIRLGHKWSAGGKLQAIIERVEPLSLLYLLLDLAALVFVVTRNV